jgi:hypothetical protein
MRRPDLIVGAEYVLYGVNDQPDTAHIRCVYLGRHDGVLELADGSTYQSTRGTLHFRISDADTDRTVLLESASTVIETTQTRTERERREAEHHARVATARAFLADLGITDVYTPGERRPGSTADDHVVSVLGVSENADELTINGLSVAELRTITGRAHTKNRQRPR